MLKTSVISKKLRVPCHISNRVIYEILTKEVMKSSILCDTMQCSESQPMIHRNLSLSSSGFKSNPSKKMSMDYRELYLRRQNSSGMVKGNLESQKCYVFQFT